MQDAATAKNRVAADEMKPTIKVRIEKLQELYCGKPTGRVIFHTSILQACDIRGAVLGRGYNSLSSMEDWVARAKADGHEVEFKQLEIAQMLDRS